MKLFKSLMAVGLMLAALIVAPLAEAQGSFDYFGPSTTLILSAPKQITSTVSNPPVDIHVFTGTVKVDIFAVTNGASAAITAALEVSTDATNWTPLLNYAIATPLAVKYTNIYSSALAWQTNNYNLSGTNTTPTASTAGFASSYLIPCPFTNTGAITVTPNGVYTIGFRADDAPRYLHVLWTMSDTNSSVGAIITGRKASPYGAF